MPFDQQAYTEFLQNFLKGHRYSVFLASGEKLDGIPIASSMVNPFNPDASFQIHLDDGTTRDVLWSDFTGHLKINNDEE